MSRLEDSAECVKLNRCDSSFALFPRRAHLSNLNGTRFQRTVALKLAVLRS